MVWNWACNISELCLNYKNVMKFWNNGENITLILGSQHWHYWHFVQDSDLLWRAALSTIRGLAVSLPSAQQMQKHPQPQTPHTPSGQCSNQKYLLSVAKGGFPGGSVVKDPPANVGDAGLICGLGRSSAGGNSNPFQYSCLENSMNSRAWQAIVHGVAKVRHNLVTKQQQQHNIAKSPQGARSNPSWEPLF